MYRKSLLSLFLVFVLSTVILLGQTGKSVAEVIKSGYSVKSFSSDPVSDNDVKTILECGMKAPSAMNKQPWKFTVVKDNALGASIVKNFTQGNVLIVVSGAESPTPGASVEFDCGLATQNMYIAAEGLGLGAHIYASPVRDVNETKKQALGIPDGYKAISVLRIGHIDKSVDATSAASSRKNADDVVIYK
ncbi:MAG TPA: nitroreductase [Bacteroidales bacterium]|nr:nitroreductase [Bacteroidales bacterium]